VSAPDEVTLWKAPQQGRDAIAEVTRGFEPAVYPGDGPFFALELQLAEQWRAVYRNGLQEIHVPRPLFEDLLRQGVIQPDTYYPGRSCHVPPPGLVLFNQAILQGTPNAYHPEPP
jgi:hypothetical protein